MVYEFAAGQRVYAFCRTIPACYNEYSSKMYGTKGVCDLLKMRIDGETNWKYSGPQVSDHQQEHIEFFAALRAGKYINNGDYMTRSTLIAIMGQLSCYTGKQVTWEQIAKSDFQWLPRPEEVNRDTDPPVKQGPDGIYPVFTPGETNLPL